MNNTNTSDTYWNNNIGNTRFHRDKSKLDRILQLKHSENKPLKLLLVSDIPLVKKQDFKSDKDIGHIPNMKTKFLGSLNNYIVISL